MLKRLVDAAAFAGKPLSICGEIASDPQLLPLLIGLGFKDLSVDIRLLPQVEESAAGLDVAACKQLAQDCLKAKTSRDVRTLLNEAGLTKKRGDGLPGANPAAGRARKTAPAASDVGSQAAGAGRLASPAGEPGY
jgi:signal transduction protein with GAF and PtsI domain